LARAKTPIAPPLLASSEVTVFICHFNVLIWAFQKVLVHLGFLFIYLKRSIKSAKWSFRQKMESFLTEGKKLNGLLQTLNIGITPADNF
jgi:hypothetical protein